MTFANHVDKPLQTEGNFTGKFKGNIILGAN